MADHRLRTEPRDWRVFCRHNAVSLWVLALGLASIVAITMAADLHRDAAAGVTAAGAPIVPVTSTSAAPLSTAPAPLPDTFPGDADGGIAYPVGEKVAPGTYASAGPIDPNEPTGCTWARWRNSASPTDQVIDNRVAKGPTTVTIKPSDKIFYTRNCQPWVRKK